MDLSFLTKPRYFFQAEIGRISLMSFHISFNNIESTGLIFSVPLRTWGRSILTIAAWSRNGFITRWSLRSALSGSEYSGLRKKMSTFYITRLTISPFRILNQNFSSFINGRRVYTIRITISGLKDSKPYGSHPTTRTWKRYQGG